MIKRSLFLVALGTVNLGIFAGATTVAAVSIETVEPEGAADCAGLQVGDTLLSWESWAIAADSERVHGLFESAFDVEVAEREYSFRGAVEISVRRGTEQISIVLEPRSWQLKARPGFADGELTKYRLGLAQAAADNVAAAAVTWQQLASALSAQGKALDAAWLYLRAARQLVKVKQWEACDQALADAISAAQAAARPDIVALILGEQGSASQLRNELEQATETFESAYTLWSETSGESLTAAELLGRAGSALQDQGRFEEASAHMIKAFEISDRLAPGSLAVARYLARLGAIEARGTDVVYARELSLLALSICERLAPRDMETAESLHTLGTIAIRLRDSDSLSYLRRSLAIKERLDPGGPSLTPTLANIAVHARQIGNQEAEAKLRQALEIERKHQPGSMLMSRIMSNLAIKAAYRRDLAESEALFRQSLTIRRRLAPGSQELARGLGNLATLLFKRGDYAGAEPLLREALAIQERLAPESLSTARWLHNLGGQACLRGDLDACESYYRRALAIREKHGIDVDESYLNLCALAMRRDDLDAAENLCSLAFEAASHNDEQTMSYLQLGRIQRKRGELAERRKDLEATEHYLSKATELYERGGSDPSEVVTLLAERSEVSLLLGKEQAASDLINRAIEICERNPGTVEVAIVNRAAALVALHQGDKDRAASLYQSAIDTIEQERAQLGRGIAEGRVGYLAAHIELYHEYIALLLDLDRPEQAFQVAERARARSLLDMLASRDLVMSVDVPPDLELARREADAEYERCQRELVELDRTKPAAAQEIVSRLHELKDRRQAIAAEVRSLSPRLAALRYPEVLGVVGVQQSLDPGSALLSYVVCENATYLFIVSGGEEQQFKALTLPLGEQELSTEIQAFRAFINNHSEETLDTTIRRARRLYEQLIYSAEPWLKRADRVLISPDGPLHVLPFAALVRPQTEEETTKPQYLVEWKPIHSVVSATVYDLIRSQSSPAPHQAARLVAFVDPHYPVAEIDPNQSGVDAELAAALGSSRSLTPLPDTRREADAIAKLWGDAATIYSGSAATEEQFKAVAAKADIVHFACHAVLNHLYPLSSALALAIPDSYEKETAQENGLLQAWEVFEQVRLDGNLVVLSACETALGEEYRGEGLLGLTRAFQYAGARSIVASLWAVSDASTATLMQRFYRGLRNGLSTDQALRQAQLSFIHSQTEVAESNEAAGVLVSSHPFSWAGFQLIGDWQ